jgi:hypothetical protein
VPPSTAPVRHSSEELCRSFVTFVGLTGDLNSFTHAPAVHHSLLDLRSSEESALRTGTIL